VINDRSLSKVVFVAAVQGRSPPVEFHSGFRRSRLGKTLQKLNKIVIIKSALISFLITPTSSSSDSLPPICPDCAILTIAASI